MSTMKSLHPFLIIVIAITGILAQPDRLLQSDGSDPSTDCGQVIGTITLDEIRNTGSSFLSQFVSLQNNSELIQRSSDVIFFETKYDINIVKLCASCRDHSDWYYERKSLVFPGYHEIYCSPEDTLIYDAKLSALALVPQYDNMTEHGLPSNLKLRTFLTMPPTRINDDGTVTKPSESFLSQWTNQVFDRHFMTTYLPGMSAASSGAIALIPDYLSSSDGTIRRSIFRQKQYEHATAVSYLALERYVMDTSNKCTLLDKVVTIYGNDADAPIAATIATLILQRFGVSCLSTFLATGPLDTTTMLQDDLRNEERLASLDTPATKQLKLWIQLMAYTLGLMSRQVNDEITWTSDTYWNTLQDKFYPISSTEVVINETTTSNGSVSVPLSGSVADLPGTVRELFHPLVVDALLSYNSTDWYLNKKDLNCSDTILSAATDNITQHKKVICYLKSKQSAYGMLLGQADRPWITNVSACYSNMSEVINGTNQYEYPGIVLDEKFKERYWNRYTQPTGLDALAIVDQDHASSVQLCAVAPLLFFTLQGHRPVNMEAWGNHAPPLTSDEMLQCSAVASPTAVSVPTVPSAPTPVNPTIVASPTMDGDGLSSPSSDSNPTIVSLPTSDSNPTVVSSPTASAPIAPSSPTNAGGIEFDGTPTSATTDKNNDNNSDQDQGSTSSAIDHLRSLTSDVVFVAIVTWKLFM